jgi:RNA polymerase sigma-70 factor (ECF subfamily)
MSEKNTKNEIEFSRLMNQHKGIIFKVVNSYCQHLDDRQDLAQEILTAMWLAIDKYNNEYKFSTWMYRIALNVAISYYRKDSKRQDKPNVDDDQLINIADLTVEEDKSEEIKQLYRFIGQLDKLNKAIMILYLESEPYESIANSLGLSKTNVATRIGRIKATLAEQFKD